MILIILFCQLTLAELTEVQINKLISRLQGKAENETKTLHTQRGTTYAEPSTVKAPHVPFTHRLMTGGWKGPKSRITIKAPTLNNPKSCKCMPHCPKCSGDCSNCTCIFELPERKPIRTGLSNPH